MNISITDNQNITPIRRAFDELVLLSCTLAPTQIAFLAAEYQYRTLAHQHARASQTAQNYINLGARWTLNDSSPTLSIALRRRRRAASSLLGWAQAYVSAHPDVEFRRRYATLRTLPPPHDEAAIEAALTLATWMET